MCDTKCIVVGNEDCDIVVGDIFLVNGLYYRIISLNPNQVRLMPVTLEIDFERGAYDNISDRLSIPEVVSFNKLDYSVVAIGNFAFYSCQRLTSVELPNSIIDIGNYAFSSCIELANIKLPDTLLSIGENAFEHCFSLSKIELPQSLSKLGDQVFYNCWGLSKIVVSKKNKTYSSLDGVLFNKDLTELIHYPDGLKQKTYTIPKTVNSIREFAFSEDSDLELIKVSKSLNAHYGLVCKSLQKDCVRDFVLDMRIIPHHIRVEEVEE